MAASGTKLFKLASQINIGRDAIVEYLVSKGFSIENKPTAALTDEMVKLVEDKFSKELKNAEKQREKIERQKELRKAHLEQGDHVSIDTIADGSERDGADAAPAAAPAATPVAAPDPAPTAPAPSPEPVVAAAPPESVPVVAQPEEAAPPAAPAPSAPRAVDGAEPAPLHQESSLQVADVVPPVASAPEPSESPATPTAVEPAPEPPVATEPARPAPVDPAAPTAEGPSVGTVIDLAKTRQPKTDPYAEYKGKGGKLPPPPKPAVKAAAPAPPSVAQPTPEQAPPAAEAQQQPTPPVADAPSQPTSDASDASGKGPGQPEGGEREKKKRKSVIEVEINPGEAPKLKGLTVIGKIDLAPKQAPRPKRNEGGRGDNRGDGRGQQGGERRGGGGGGRGAIGDAMARGGQGGGQGGGGQRGPNDRNQGPRGPVSTGSNNTGTTTPNFGPPKAKATASKHADKKKRKTGAKGAREQFSDKDVERAIRQTLSGMEDTGGTGKAKGRIQRKREREMREQLRQDELARESTTLRLSEFVSTADLANLMRVSAAEIIMKCMGLGLMVSINQRLDKDTILLIADDYGFAVEFLDEQTSEDVQEEEDAPESLKSRPPIVTIMGHVDHGKTSLLDYIRNANVVAGEAGGITQHIGAYQVEVAGGRHITFLDTPGHEAFTAMRARGAQVTDIVILVVAADDSVMPQTIEAISHAQAANVPIVVAINKIDRAEANPDRIRQQLADHGVLVEEWGGKNQCAEISAKSGLGVESLLEKILIEADLMDLKANPDRKARGTVIEAHVDRGRGNVVTLIVQKGTLDVGDIFVCGQFAGRVRAMTDERGNRVDAAGPAMPVQVTGFDGLPNAGDVLFEMDTDAEARDIANRRQQLRREQQFRGMRHMTLDDISAQISAGGVKELRLIVKADVTGSVEALSDSLQKLSTSEVQVKIILKAVGAISESDIMLAAASDAIIVGFQVNVPTAARKLAEGENVDVRLYSIIYDCINEVQLALEGMLSPDLKEEITGTIEVRAIFKISRLGTIAGCYVQNGKVTRNDKVRVLRDGFEIYKGTLTSLKRNKDDVREVDSGYECGIGIQGFNDIEEGDIIEAYKTVEVKRTLSN
ncbi:MAG: translation initiation factor IF-2 [Candidatus Kapabacteria bacterium]|nr:translation initiation factor IF-2 [Candidatus Kapabacteria bacterium]